MSEDEIESFVEEAMTEVRAFDVFDPKHASKADSRAYLKGIIEACKLELEGLGGDDEGMGDESDDEPGYDPAGGDGA